VPNALAAAVEPALAKRTATAKPGEIHESSLKSFRTKTKKYFFPNANGMATERSMVGQQRHPIVAYVRQFAGGRSVESRFQKLQFQSPN